MARILSAQGREVRLLAIIDTGPGGTTPRRPGELLGAFWLFLRNLPRWIPGTLLRVPPRRILTQMRRTLRKYIKELMLNYRGLQRPESHLRAEDIFDMGDWPDRLRALVNDNLRAVLEFRYRPYTGRVVLFRTRIRPLFHSHARDLGWSRLVLGALEIVELGGNHATIFDIPYVHELARGLQAAMNAAEGDPVESERTLPGGGDP
jgi:thioesterase domain-containing protein